MTDFIFQSNVLIITVALCIPRILGAVVVSPFFNPQILHGIARNSILLSFSLIVFPIVLPFVSANKLSALSFFTILLKEGMIGAFLGFLMGLFFWGIEAVGCYIDYQRGAFMASLINPATGAETSLLGSFLMQLAILLFFSNGGFLIFLSALYESYRIWPILSFFPKFDPEFPLLFLNKAGELMRMALLLASPVLIPLFLSDFIMGMINRFSPQLNVLFLSLPIKCALALFILILYLTFFLFYLNDDFAQWAKVFSVLRQVIN